MSNDEEIGLEEVVFILDQMMDTLNLSITCVEILSARVDNLEEAILND